MANYFVTYDYADQLSGIEHAQLKRMSALREKTATPNKLVSLAYNRFLTRSLKKNGIDPAEFINMYDFLQGISVTTLENYAYQIPVTQLIAENEVVLDQNEVMWTVGIGNVTTKKIYLMNNPVFDLQINYVEFFDGNGYKIKTDYYDIRGFKSMSDIYGQRGGVAREINFDLAGQPVVESVYKREPNGAINATQWFVSDGHGAIKHSFSQKAELEGYFFDQLNKSTQEENTFISDRAFKTDQGLLNMRTARKMYAYWHSTFVPNGKDPLTTKPFDTLLDEIKAADKIDGLIAATSAEAEDLQRVVEGKIPVFKINSALIDERTMEFNKFSRRHKYEIITVARLSEEKRLDLGVEIFAKVVKRVPQAKWHIYGYNQNGNRQKLEQQIADLNLQANIMIHPYQNDLNEIYENAQLFWMLSLYEGFNMAQLEAMSHGVPVVAFDIKYGPAELIDQARNGYLIENHNLDDFAKRTVELLKSQFTLEKLGKESQLKAGFYNKDEMAQQWLELLN